MFPANESYFPNKTVLILKWEANIGFGEITYIYNMETKMQYIKITHTPNNVCDPNQMLRKQVKEKYCKCPFCDESKLVRILGENGVYHQMHYGRYGKPRPLWKNLFAKKTQWYFYTFRCNSCGTEWETEEFPEIKIKGVKSLPVELWEYGE